MGTDNVPAPCEAIILYISCFVNVPNCCAVSILDYHILLQAKDGNVLLISIFTGYASLFQH